MRKTALAISVATMVILPAAVGAQGFGVGARAGTLGFGVEGAAGLSNHVAVRGGLGLWTVNIDATGFWEPGTGVSATLHLPKTWYNIGVDLYPTSGDFRIGGGMLYKPDDPKVVATADPTASVDIGGRTYTSADVAEVEGSLVSKKSAPYVLIGFGRHTRKGFGLFLDLGVAFLGEPSVQLKATRGDPTIINSADFQSALAQESANLESDLPTWAKKYWFIASVGIKLGLG
ncbi:MAG: hypothetical protein LJF04_19675 [Gemmatimonadetes bacterium]|nr:hypothetical protein [Gemmatimonadota bacterium]